MPLGFLFCERGWGEVVVWMDSKMGVYQLVYVSL